ncbi:hypothetical protein [Nitratireductor sp. GCM10026969]|uniref:hypothetical protein n=1 Tax=Nitratireductor sp. GCM10026969 TaxID=3252645 RepID=UPI0036235099
MKKRTGLWGALTAFLGSGGAGAARCGQEDGARLRRVCEVQEATARDLIHIGHRLEAVEKEVTAIRPTSEEYRQMRERVRGAGTFGYWLFRIGGVVLSAAAGFGAAYTWLTGRLRLRSHLQYGREDHHAPVAPAGGAFLLLVLFKSRRHSRRLDGLICSKPELSDNVITVPPCTFYVGAVPLIVDWSVA